MRRRNGDTRRRDAMVQRRDEMTFGFVDADDVPTRKY